MGLTCRWETFRNTPVLVSQTTHDITELTSMGNWDGWDVFWLISKFTKSQTPCSEISRGNRFPGTYSKLGGPQARDPQWPTSQYAPPHYGCHQLLFFPLTIADTNSPIQVRTRKEVARAPPNHHNCSGIHSPWARWSWQVSKEQQWGRGREGQRAPQWGTSPSRSLTMLKTLILALYFKCRWGWYAWMLLANRKLAD